MNTEERQHVRKRLGDLSYVELLQLSFLIGLCTRIECELQAYAAIFAPDTALDPPPNNELAGIQLLIASETQRRSGTKTKAKTNRTLKLVDTEGETNHVQNGNTNSNEH